MGLEPTDSSSDERWKLLTFLLSGKTVESHYNPTSTVAGAPGYRALGPKPVQDRPKSIFKAAYLGT